MTRNSIRHDPRFKMLWAYLIPIRPEDQQYAGECFEEIEKAGRQVKMGDHSWSLRKHLGWVKENHYGETGSHPWVLIVGQCERFTKEILAKELDLRVEERVQKGLIVEQLCDLERKWLLEEDNSAEY